MEKIYSRKRIHIPKLYRNAFPNKRIDKTRQILIKIIAILVISIIFMCIIINAINPIIDKLCVNASKEKATLISNKKATEIMSNYSYDDMVTIYRDKDDNITMIKSNIIAVNEITSDVAIKIQEEFEKNRDSKINVKLRKFNRSQIFIRIWT